ncbi:hypothetical protein HZH68_005945 [Vespula germanica]|uniref:Uncharacterized protein n=1 Tax=Vespula germanica TaxID=30212 RepID=A0A834KM72_VESGE|nr:hypothetical protein HZH68_005945 [Vespula germanica]
MEVNGWSYPAMDQKIGEEMQPNANVQINQQNLNYYMEQQELNTQASPSLLETILRHGKNAVQDGYSNSCADSVSPQSNDTTSLTEGCLGLREAIVPMGYEQYLTHTQPQDYGRHFEDNESLVYTKNVRTLSENGRLGSLYQCL